MLIFSHKTMKQFIYKLSFLSILLLSSQACTRSTLEPASSLAVREDSKGLVTAAQVWFTKAAGSSPVSIDWQQAHVINRWVIAPLTNTSNPFADKQKYGHRYAIVQVPTTGSPTGRIVELVVGDSALVGEEAMRKALVVAQPVFLSTPIVHIDDFTGWLLTYSPDYDYETGLVYKEGTLQPVRIQIHRGVLTENGQTSTANRSAECITVSTCGYVNGYLSNCIYDTYCGSGGGGIGGGGGGSGGGGGGYGGTGGTTTNGPVAEDGPVTVGDRAKVITYQYDNLTQIKVAVEWTQATHKVDKVTLTTVGVTYGTTFVQVGEGIASYREDTGLFRYSTYCQFQAGTTQTGPIANGTLFRVYGTLNPVTGQASIHMEEQQSPFM